MKDTTLGGYLLVSDLDGTLVTNKGEIPSRNISAIERFMLKGGRFAFATGRSVLGAERFTAQIMPNTPSIVYNGGGIYDFSEKKLLWSEFLPGDYGRIIQEIRSCFPEVGIELYSGGQVYYINKNKYTKAHIAFQGISASQLSPEDLPEGCNKILFCGEADRLQAVSDHLLSKEQPGCAFVFSGPVYFEVLPQGITKGATVRVLADLVGIGHDRVFSIGDYYNDLELLSASALSAAPKDAPDDIKSVADVIVGKCEDGAVADFIEYIEDRFG